MSNFCYILILYKIKVNEEWGKKVVDSKEMWHKTKNIKKNYAAFILNKTPLRKPTSIQEATNYSKEEIANNKEARSQLKDKGKYLANHFYRCCKSREGTSIDSN